MRGLLKCVLFGKVFRPLWVIHALPQMAWIIHPHLRCPRAASILLALMLLLTGEASAQVFDSYGLSYALRPDLSEDAVLVANNGIRVPFGRSVFIDPINDLVIQVQPGDRCGITVLDNDPLSQRPGHLSPKKFPCEFGPNDVKYSHFGSRSPAKDRVRLQLRYDTQTDTVIIPFMMEVEVIFTQLEVVTKNMPLTVDTPLGSSNPIDRRTLEFTFDRGTHQCKIASLSPGSALPRYGKLVDDGNLGTMFDCDEFMNMNVRYQHTFAFKSPNRDYIPMFVELQDMEGNLLKQEFFQILVRIKDGEDNSAPKPSFVAMMMMEVDQFVMTAITTDMLAAEDIESIQDDLIFNITSPLSFEEGYIVSTDDRNLPITSFYQGDLKELKIAYKPPAEDSDTERIFQIVFEIVDTEGAVSDPFAFMIVVKPMNTLAPVVTKNSGQLLYEGQSRPLSSSHNLEISDEDNLDKVRVNAVAGLRHGHLSVLGSGRKFFTPADLDAGIVVYQHDGSDTYSDNIIFRMTDGQHEVEFLFPITVVPTDDEPPIINANTGLVLSKNQIMLISPLMLSAADIDSEDSTILFSMEAPFSAVGQVLLRQAEAPEDPSTWRFNAEEELYEKAVTDWLQQDITDGKLFYKHVGPHSTDTVMDQFVFRVQDDNDPPNQSGRSSFIVKVLPVDDLPPAVYPGTTLQMTVHEYQLTFFRKKFLRYTDLDSEDRDLKYTIVQPPTDTDENSPVVLGSIVLTEKPDTEVITFTQAQINHHKISYKPPYLELGITTHVLQFKYTVEDSSGNRAEGVFTITLQPVDNTPPEITNSGFGVFERGTHVLSSTELHTFDTDTDSRQISFTLAQAPLHGHFRFTFADMTKGDAFSLEDIRHGRISYTHNGDESSLDTVQLDVSDGVHVVPVTIRIGVKPVDDETPTIALPPGTIGSYMDVLENGATEITTNVIQGRDEDTDDLRLTYIVEDPPVLGQILVNGAPASRFTQADIISGRVLYAHTSGEIGVAAKEDFFNLTLTDLSDEWTVGGNKITGVRVHVTVLPLDSQAPEVFVGTQFVVTEGGKSAIEISHISSSDVDTPNDDLLCTIIVQPTSGYVENISPAPGSEKSRSGTAISAFTMKDIRQSHISYVQSIHRGVEPVEDRFAFRCSDGINYSERHFFPIAVIPSNDEKPEIYMREFVVMEGMNIVIDTPILNGADADEPADELMFIVTRGPKHGDILHQLTSGTVAVTNFTLDQIREASSIVYEHDDSETTEDSFDVVLTDGKFSVEKTVIVMIIPIDDETPRMAVNDGLEVEIGDLNVISSNVLKATDLDSEDSSLTYVVRYGPSQGYLQKTPMADGSLVNVTVGMNFTQNEVDLGLIVYVHNGQEGIRDLIKFDVTDGTNALIDRYFYVTIGGIDMVFPDVVNKGVALKEGGRVSLTTDLLSTTDLNSPDEHLVFTITRAPARGHLECTDTPGTPISSFTQLQLAGSKIYYVHTADDEVKMDSFEFEVTDGYNPVFRTFRILISNVDNKRPVVTTHGLSLAAGEDKLITPFELTVEDRDTAEHLLRFTITQVPVHGRLLFNGTRPVSSFTKQDLNENLITYRHDGTPSAQDSFSFTVTDGTHTDFFVFPDTAHQTRRPQVMKISILTVENGVPQVTVNKGAPTLRVLDTGHLGFLITAKTLKAEDRGGRRDSVIFRVSVSPEHGYLIHLGKGNATVSRFTQADIDDMKICYVLRTGDNATSDTFHFSIQDRGGNQLRNQPFRLNWSWISLETESYTVDEESGLLEVVLRRRGYLGETSFVSIAAVDGTAQQNRDFRGKSQKQVQFNPGQTTAVWKVRILPDGEYEESERFRIVLSEPVMAVLEFPEVATVEILDPGDESSVFLPSALFTIQEDVGDLLIPVQRSGDLSEELLVVCSTQQATATGTVPTSVLSYSDYISRPEDHRSVLLFGRGEAQKTCRVVIIDDSLYEGEESFNVSLSMPVGGRLAPKYPTATVTILPHAEDAPVFYLGQALYQVDESDGSVEVQVLRTGTDLSKAGSVTLRSRKTDPVSAEAGEDYVGLSRNLDFAAGVSLQTVRVAVLDDLGRPRLEGPETFQLVLRMPVNGVLGEPGRTTVLINDSVSDLPKVQFREAVYSGEESGGRVEAVVYRSGDLSFRSTVRCYTRQGTAQVMMDFTERPNTDASVLTFLPGEVEKPCVLTLVDDTEHEEVEELRLVLGNPRSESPYGASVGARNETLVRIRDDADKSIIRFGETKFSVLEPQGKGQVALVRVPVLRVGDASKVSLVRVHTKDGSATAGEDYHPVSEELVFRAGERQHLVEVEVLFDGVREMREAFTLHLRPDENMVAETKMSKAIVYIEEASSMADVTFPAVPYVVSLLLYDDPEGARRGPPVAGYPVICVTACDLKYSEYHRTGSICVSENINNTLTRFRWLVSAPAGPDGVTSPLREVDFDTFFTSSKRVTLDSVYFQAGSRVQCAARAVTADGEPGLELSSTPTAISLEEGMCQPRVVGSVGAEPFSAKLRYTGASDADHPNLIKLTVNMPHIDGMLPVISTRPLSNFELTLSPDGTRVGNHRCSNLLDAHEVQTRHGFLTADANSAAIGETAPYQHSAALRGAATLRFYRNLQLEACQWEFSSYYDMSELLSDCGGTIGTDGQVLNLVQSYVTLRVPLHVSYVFHSPVGAGGWQHFDLQSELRLTFVYDTAILWKDGVGSPPEAELQGALYPTSMRINSQGLLVVNFRTEARFRGLFVLSHPGSFMSSMVMCPDHSGLSFNLSLVRTEPTYNQPIQQWSFVSDFAVRDYSGSYTVKLLPCASPPNLEYSIPPTCSPRDPVTFDLDIRFQQVSDPVAAEFSLNTELLLLSKRALWLSDGSMGFGQESDTAFSQGDVIYGRVMVDPVQNLGDSFVCSIEKIFLCTGADGYVPKYNPDGFEFGCLADSPSLLYRFKIIDKAQPETQARAFGSLAFEAYLAVDDPGALALVRQPGSDGFRMDSSPLFQVAAGREWFIHTIYTVRSRENANRGVGKRSLEYHAVSRHRPHPQRHRRAAAALPLPDLAEQIGAGTDRGTNILHIALDRGSGEGGPRGPREGGGVGGGDGGGGEGVVPRELNVREEEGGEEGLVLMVGVLVALLLTALVAVVIALMVRARRDKAPSPPPLSASTEPMVRGGGDSSEV